MAAFHPFDSSPNALPVRASRDPFRLVREVPGSVQVSFWAFLCVAGIRLIFFIVGQVEFNWPEYLARAAAGFPHNGRVEQVPPGAAIAGEVISAAFSLGFIAVSILLAYQIRSGLNWARIVLTVWAVLAVPTALGGYVLSYLVAAVLVAATVYMWLPRSNAFFRTVKADRKRHKAHQLP